MSLLPHKCKHGVYCFWRDDQFIGCQKCYIRGKLDFLKSSPARVKNMTDKNPFEKSSLLSRSPQGTTTRTNTDDKTDDIATPVSVETSNQTHPEISVKEILEKAEVVIKEGISITHNDTKAINQVQGLKSTIEGLVNIVKKEEEKKEEQKKIIDDLQNRLLALEKKEQRHSETRREIPQPQATYSGKYAILSNDGENNEDDPMDDEDPEDQIVEEETDWILCKQKRKRNEGSDSSPQTTQAKKGRKADTARSGSRGGAEKVATSSKNTNGSFNSSNDKDKNKGTKNTENKKENEVSKKLVPPPFKVTQLKSISEVKKFVENIDSDKYKLTALVGNVWKINTADHETYRLVRENLEKHNAKWYTFSDKHLRPKVFVAKGMHSTTDLDEITEDLTSKGFNIVKVVNLLSKKDENGKRKGLPLHQIIFDNKDDTKKIFEIKFIAHQKVEIKNVKHNPARIPQCHRCQGFLHTQAFCHKDPKCVKCSGPHLSFLCAEKKVDSPKCVNCGQKHTANYSGCEIAKFFKERRLADLNKKKQKNSGKENSGNKLSQRPVSKNVSFARMASDGKSNDKENSESLMEKILNFLNEQATINAQILSRLDALEGILLGNDGT